MLHPKKYLIIDEEGFPLFGELRVTDPLVAMEIYRNLRKGENGAFVTQIQGDDLYVEAFDEPLVAAQVLKLDQGWRILLPFGVEYAFDLETLRLDEWDRFHGRTASDLPFVFSRKAQAEFFRLLDDYTDETITADGKEIEIPAYWSSEKQVRQENFWSDIYRADDAGWELNEPSPSFKDLLPRLKLPKSRVLVLGCGSGNDAAFFAEHGHVVTSVDISAEALKNAKAKYGHMTNIQWVKMDIFKLPRDFDQAFDIVVEHTCYCAIDPIQRPQLVKTWIQCLVPGGHLMGVFFGMDKMKGPPFGGTEWELRERLKRSFHFIFWGRSHESIQRRDGKEFVVYAQKKY